MKKFLIALLLVISVFACSCSGLNNDKDKNTDDTKTTTFTVKFETNGGTKINDISFTDISTFDMPENPTKEGFEFLGWYFDSNFSNLFSKDKMTNANITLYAKWSENLKAEIVSVEGATIEDKEIFMLAEKETEKIDLSKIVTVGKNCTWRLYLDVDCTSEIPTKNTGTLKNHENDFYIFVNLRDSEESAKYHLSIHKKGNISISLSDGENILKSFNSTCFEILDDSNFENISVFGYNIDGWQIKDANDSLIDFAIGENGVKVKESITLYAKLSSKTFMVSFKTNADGITVEPKNVVFGNRVEFDVLERTGYDFLGWYYLDENNSETELCGSDGICQKYIYENLNVYAKWSCHSTTLSLEAESINGGEGYICLGESELRFTDNSRLVTSRVRTGYVGITLYDKVYYGSSFEDSYFYNSGNWYAKTTSANTTFVGWFIDDVCVSEEQEFEYVAGPEKDAKVTLVAKFAIYTLTTDVRTGSSTGTVTEYNKTGFKAGKNLTITATPSKTYIFCYWNLIDMDTYETQYKYSTDQNLSFTMIKANVKLQAVFAEFKIGFNTTLTGFNNPVKNTGTITVNGGDAFWDSKSIGCDLETDLTLVAKAESGYKFSGWYIAKQMGTTYIPNYDLCKDGVYYKYELVSTDLTLTLNSELLLSEDVRIYSSSSLADDKVRICALFVAND